MSTSELISETPSAAHHLAYVRRLYDNVESWYTSADNKAQILLALDGVFLGFLTSTLFMDATRLASILSLFGTETVVALAVLVICLSLSVFAALMCLRSRVKRETGLKAAPGTMFFFGHLSGLQPNDFLSQLRKVDAEYELDVLASQILLLSRTVRTKHLWVNVGFALLIGALFAFVILAVTYFARVAYGAWSLWHVTTVAAAAVALLVGAWQYGALSQRELEELRPLVEWSRDGDVFPPRA